MFDNIGKRIKRLAKATCFMEVLSCCVLGMILCIVAARDGEPIKVCYGLILVAGGSVIAWLSNLAFYALGEVAECLKYLVEAKAYELDKSEKRE